MEAKKFFAPLTIGDLKKLAESGEKAIVDGASKVLIPVKD